MPRRGQPKPRLPPWYHHEGTTTPKSALAKMGHNHMFTGNHILPDLPFGEPAGPGDNFGIRPRVRLTYKELSGTSVEKEEVPSQEAVSKLLQAASQDFLVAKGEESIYHFPRKETITHLDIYAPEVIYNPRSRPYFIGHKERPTRVITRKKDNMRALGEGVVAILRETGHNTRDCGCKALTMDNNLEALTYATTCVPNFMVRDHDGPRGALDAEELKGLSLIHI